MARGASFFGGGFPWDWRLSRMILDFAALGVGNCARSPRRAIADFEPAKKSSVSETGLFCRTDWPIRVCSSGGRPWRRRGRSSAHNRPPAETNWRIPATLFGFPTSNLRARYSANRLSSHKKGKHRGRLRLESRLQADAGARRRGCNNSQADARVRQGAAVAHGVQSNEKSRQVFSIGRSANLSPTAGAPSHRTAF